VKRQVRILLGIILIVVSVNMISVILILVMEPSDGGLAQGNGVHPIN